MSPNIKPRTALVAIIAVFLILSTFTYIVSDEIKTFAVILILSAMYLLLTVVTLFLIFGRRKPGRTLIALFFVGFFACYTPDQAGAMIGLPPGTVLGTIDHGKVVQKDGSPVLDMNGNALGVVTNGNKVVLVAYDSYGQTNQPNVTLCELLGGMLVVGVATIIGYKLYKCAKHCLYPPTNAPPTNCPPTDGDNVMVRALSPTSPTQFYVDDTCSGIGQDTTVAANGWTDWQGYPVIACFGGAVTNVYSLNLDGSTNWYGFQSSSNLSKWYSEYYFVTGWVSGGYGYPTTNTTSITYDCMGTPFSTNWSSSTAIAGSRHCVPVRSGVPRLFYQLSQLP